MGFLANLGASIGSFGLDMIGANQERKENQRLANQQADLAKANMEMQKEFAKNGIRWRVDDAVAAGLHPLAALGTMPSSYSPVGMNIVDSGYTESKPWSNLGQNLSRAAMSMTTMHEKKMNLLQEMNLKKQNEYIDEQINASKFARLKNTGPGIPSAVQTVYDRDGYALTAPSTEMGAMMQGNTPLTWQWYLDNSLSNAKDLGSNTWSGVKSEAPVRLLYKAASGEWR